MGVAFYPEKDGKEIHYSDAVAYGSGGGSGIIHHVSTDAYGDTRVVTAIGAGGAGGPRPPHWPSQEDVDRMFRDAIPACDWAEGQFGGLRFDRGRFAGRRMLDVARRFPKYIEFSYRKGARHMGIPRGLYEACEVAAREGVTCDEVLDRISIAMRALSVEAPQHSNCRSVLAPVTPDEDPVEEGSFLDGIL
jgi:hypothetical protein